MLGSAEFHFLEAKDFRDLRCFLFWKDSSTGFTWWKVTEGNIRINWFSLVWCHIKFSLSPLKCCWSFTQNCLDTSSFSLFPIILCSISISVSSVTVSFCINHVRFKRALSIWHYWPHINTEWKTYPTLWRADRESAATGKHQCVLSSDVIGRRAPAGEKPAHLFPVLASEGHPRERDVSVAAAVRRRRRRRHHQH